MQIPLTRRCCLSGTVPNKINNEYSSGHDRYFLDLHSFVLKILCMEIRKETRLFRFFFFVGTLVST